MKTGTKHVWSRSAGPVLLALALAIVSTGETVAVGAHTRDARGTASSSKAAHMASLRSLPAGLAPAVQHALAHAALVDRTGHAAAATPMSGTWTQQAELHAPSSAGTSEFGEAVALSNTTALVGAPDANRGQGAVFVFTRGGSTWTQQQEFTPTAGGAFGWSVALSGNTAVIGAPNENGFAGAAYVFVNSGGIWMQQARLALVPRVPFASFGYAVGISGGTIVVGTNNTGTNGTAYVFVRSGTTWIKEAQLTATDGALNDLFGVSVALSANTAFIGAYGKNSGAGAAYVFTRSGSTWTQQQEITATDGIPNGNFGIVALSGTVAAVGAPGQGTAYVYVRSGPGITATWTLQTELPTPNQAYGFGAALAISGATLVIGAPSAHSLSSQPAGAAYVYVSSGGTWSQQAWLIGSNTSVNSALGAAVAASGNSALIGSYAQQRSTGAAYVFVRG